MWSAVGWRTDSRLNSKITVIESLKSGAPASLPELATLGRTLNRTRVDALAYFPTNGASSRGTKAINDLIELANHVAEGIHNSES